MLDVRHLRQVTAIHRLGSFAKAARALGITQPSLSTSIARLEDELKIKIFNRTAAGSELTPVGELILSRAPSVIQEADHILRDAALVASGEGGEVRIGFGTAIRDSFQPRLLLHIAERHPNLRLSITVAPAGILVPRLLARELDVAVMVRSDELAESPLQFTPVFACDFLAAVAPAHPLAGQSAVTMTQLQSHRWAGARYSYRNSRLFSLADDHAHATAFQGEDFNALGLLARAGLCVLIAPVCAMLDSIETGALVPVDIDLNRSLVFGIAATRAVGLSPTIRKIIGYAVEIGDQIQSTMVVPGR